MRQTTRILGSSIVVAMAMLVPLAVSAQSDLDASEAQQFIGSWTVAMTSDFGDFTMDLEIQEEGGKVAASIGAPDMGGPMESVSDVTRNGEDLVLAWEMDAQGQLVPASLTLTPDGDGLTTMFSVADGQFMAPGEATRAEN